MNGCVTGAVGAALERENSFYFATVQVEKECVDTPGAADIDIAAGSTSAGHSSPDTAAGHGMHSS